MTTELHLLPYQRRGAIRSVARVDAGSGPLPAATIRASVTVDGTVVARDVRILGPDTVQAIGAAEILRRYPVPGSTGAEVAWFPLVELASADLPWRYTPAAAGPDGRLRPWLVLVVVPADGEGVTFTSLSGGTDRLTVGGAERALLPPLAESWAWAHVQSTVPAADLDAGTATDPAVTTARLLAPRRLEPDRSYRVALVRAFTVGADGTLAPAWTDGGTEAAELAVYDSWTFTTAADAATFELLCERLVPATAVGSLGLRDVDVSAPGVDVAWDVPAPVLNPVGGALWDLDAASPLPPVGTEDFRAATLPLLETALARRPDLPVPARYDPLRDDPVVSLPLYGQHQAEGGAGATGIPAAGWLLWANTRTDRRIAAGLGAQAVRRAQEPLLAAAWDQAGQLREANDELNRARLAAEIDRSWQARLAATDDGDAVATAGPLLTFATLGGRPALAALRSSAAPVALAGAAWLRHAPRPPGTRASTAMLLATAPAPGRFAGSLDFQPTGAPAGCFQPGAAGSSGGGFDGVLTAGAINHVLTHTLPVELDLDDLRSAARRPVVRGAPHPAGAAALSRVPARRARPVPAAAARTDDGGLPERPDDTPVELPTQPAALVDVSTLATVVAAFDPLELGRRGVVARVAALEPLLGAGELPCRVRIGPVFPDPLFWDLLEVDRGMVLPGAAGFPDNGVRLVGVNGAFVASFLLGANHEMARELLWREYPADLGATTFRRFFDHLDGGNDIEPIEAWPAGATLESRAGAVGASSVIVVRGDVVARYPDLHVFVAPGVGGEPQLATALGPIFEGLLGSDMRFFGFDVTTGDLRGEGAGEEWFVGFEERVVAPRFGLDLGRASTPTTWDELTWAQFGDAVNVPATTVPGLPSLTIDDVTWGRNSAHQGAAVHRRPYRRLFPATTLVPA